LHLYHGFLRVEQSGFSILLVDNQPLMIAGLLSFLADRKDCHVIGQVTRKTDLPTAVSAHRPDLIIADYNIEGFVTLGDLEQIIKDAQAHNVLIISSDNDKTTILKALQIGIKGYLTKSCSKDEVLMAIQSTAKGEKFFCHKILDIIMEKHFSPPAENCDPTILTVRETEILKLIARGRSTQQIADALHLSPHTVQTHRKSIIRKLNIKSPTEFVIYALDLGILSRE
jgi:two-component system, NarL family, invasion response regulator UvrY